mgnify:CR=1 FL=1|jgi:hypothetical protein
MIEEDCQTDDVQNYSREIQVDIVPETVATGTDCDNEFIENLEKSIEKRLKAEFEKVQRRKSIAALAV